MTPGSKHLTFGGSAQGTPAVIARARAVSALIGGIVLVIGIAVLIGWVLEIGWLRSLRPEWEEMKANTAIAFIFAGLSLVALRFIEELRWAKAAAIFAALVPLSVGALTLAEYLFQIDLGIDQLVLAETPGPHTHAPGRMAPIAAFDFMLGGAALLALTQRGRALDVAAQCLACVIVVLGYTAILGYLFSASALYQTGPFVSMALHTAVGQVLLAFGLMAATPEAGFTKALLSRGACCGGSCLSPLSGSRRSPGYGFKRSGAAFSTAKSPWRYSLRSPSRRCWRWPFSPPRSFRNAVSNKRSATLSMRRRTPWS